MLPARQSSENSADWFGSYCWRSSVTFLCYSLILTWMRSSGY